MTRANRQTRTERRERLRKQVAYHEAAHAVVGILKELRFSTATIKADGGTLGCVVFNRHRRFFEAIEVGDRSPRIRQWMESRIVVDFAGQIAESRFMGKQIRWGMHSDNQNAVGIAMSFGSQATVEAYLKYCWHASEDLVNMHWRLIEAVAKGLLDRETLKERDVREIMFPGATALRDSLQSRARRSPASSRAAEA